MFKFLREPDVLNTIAGHSGFAQPATQLSHRLPGASESRVLYSRFKEHYLSLRSWWFSHTLIQTVLLILSTSQSIPETVMEHEFSPRSASPSKSSSPLSLIPPHPGPTILLRILRVFTNLIFTQCNDIGPILIPILEMRKPGYTTHNSSQIIELKKYGKFKPEYPSQTNSLDSIPSSLDCVDRLSLTGAFSFQGIARRASTVPCFDPRKRGLVLLEDPTDHKHTPTTNLLRDIWVLQSPGIWCLANTAWLVTLSFLF